MGDQNGGWNIVKLLIVERAGQLVEKRWRKWKLSSTYVSKNEGMCSEGEG